MGIASFLHTAMVHQGLTPEEAYARFYVCDADGLVTSKRVLDDSNAGSRACKPFAEQRKDLPEGMQLADVVKAARPTVLMGASTVAGLFTDEILAGGLLRTTTRLTLCPSSSARLYEHSP